MKTDLKSFDEFYKAVCKDELVFMFGTGISAALTGKRYSWYKWIIEGIQSLHDSDMADQLQSELDGDSSADNLIAVAGKVISAAKDAGTYALWMHNSFETVAIQNSELAYTLQKLATFHDVFATTNYDLLLERATGLEPISYEHPNQAVDMLMSGRSNYVLHIHGIYDSAHGVDDIVASKEQYESVLSDKGAQFIQNVLGTRTLVFIGCGKTTEDVNIRQFVEFAHKYLKLDRPYYFLYNSASPVDGLPDNIRLIPYGDEYSDLPGFLEDLAQERIRNKWEKFRLIGRTLYSQNTIDAYGLSEYHFSRENLDFRGRKYELGLLNSFLESDRMNAWWAITGQAGAGKSRLAFELMKRSKNSWFSFFLNVASHEGDAKSFVPFSDTLVIVDYVLGNEANIATIVNGLIDAFSQSTPQYKLRILFLERENLTISGTWYHNLEQSFKPYDRSRVLSMEYHPNPSVTGHDFLNIEDLLDGDVCKLIGDICKKRGLGEDPYRDRQLKENYARKYERLRFRPLFVQIYVQAWIENGQSDNDYRNYRELLDAVIKKEVEHFSSIFDGDINSVSSLIHLLVRASVSPLVADALPDGYKDFWSWIQKYIQNHSLPGFGRKQKTQSMIKETTQSLNLEESIIDPLYPDLIKEALFLSYVDDYDSFGQELWENEPGIFSVFLYRCLIDFPDNDELVDYVCRQSNDKSNIYAMRSRQALMHRDVIAPGDDPEKLNEIADREYTYWLSVDGSGKIYQELRIDGLTSVLHTFLGWSRKEAFQIMDDIISSPGNGKLETKKIDAILETAQYFTKWSSFEASENTIGKLKNYVGLSHESELEIQSLHIINQAGLVGLKLYQSQHDKEWEKVQNLIDKLRDTCDMGSEQDAEVYTRTILEVTKLAQIRFAGGPGCDIFYLLQDYAEEWAKHGKVAFNDQIHYNYLYAKYIHVDNVAVSSTLAFGNSLYAVRLIDDYIKEVTGNIMIRDFSGLLIGAYALKVGYDDNVTDHEANNYLAKAEELLDVYPDSALLAAKYIELMDDCYEYQFKRRIPQNRVVQAFSIVLRFPEEYEVLDNFYKLLKNSEEKHNWVNYVKIKSVVNGLIRNRLDEYLVKPEDEKQETGVRSYKKIGRNEPCPCGSGIKFKKCCLGKGIYD